MGVIKLEYVIRYSSQDPIFKAENLLLNKKSKPWLCSKQDHSGHLEAEFQLERASSIHYIDIGNFGSSTIEVQVGKSSSQQSTSYVSLLPAAGLLSLADIKAEADIHSVFMFDKKEINESTFDEQWDRVKIICCQPYKKKVQFGLAFLSLRSKEDSTNTSLDNNNNVILLDAPSNGIPRRVSLDAECCMSRGKRMLNASKTTTNAHIVKLNGPLEEQFKEGATNFLIAYREEIEETQKSVEDYLEEFAQQCQRNLTYSEKAFFQNEFKVLIKNISIYETSQNSSDLIVKNGCHKLTNTPLSSSPTSQVGKPNSTTVIDETHHNPLKRPAQVSMSSSVASFSKKKCSYSSERLAETSNFQKKKNIGSASEVIPVKKQNNGPTDSQTPCSKFGFSRASVGIPDVKKESNGQKDSQTPMPSKIGLASASAGIPDMKKECNGQKDSQTAILSKIGLASASAGIPDVKKECNGQKDSQTPIPSQIGLTRPEDFIQPDGIQPSTSSGITYAVCPLCNNYFSAAEIEKHASTCRDFSSLGSKEYLECPICMEMFPEDEITFHAEKCLF